MLLIPHLHGFVVPGVGALEMLQVENLFTGTILNQGLAVYALTFSLPMSFPLPAPAGGLDDFQTLQVSYDVPPLTSGLHGRWLADDNSAGAPDAQDRIEMAR